MAGAKDSPEDRLARDAAAIEIPPPPDDGDDIVDHGPAFDGGLVLQASGANGVRGPRVMVAAGERILASDRAAMGALRRRRQPWQTEAWAYFDEVGEIKYSLTLVGNLMAKLRLFPAVRIDTADMPVPLDHTEAGIDDKTRKIAQATLERLRSNQGGQAAMIHDFSINMDVAGEAYLVGVQGPQGEDGSTSSEDWTIRSVDEIVAQGDDFVAKDGPGSTAGRPLKANDLVIRLWQPHARFRALADAPMRGVLSECESLMLLSREVRATVKSRLMNGLLLWPNGLSWGSPDRTKLPIDGEGTDDPVLNSLMDAVELAIQEEGAASAMVPPIISGDADKLKELRHVSIARNLDATLDDRIEKRMLRIARGLNLPVETVMGLMQTTFANAAQVERQQFDAHIEPRAVLLCDAWTSGYFRDALIEAGVDRDMAERIFIWFDPSALIIIPDQAEQAKDAYAAQAISGAALRKYLGYTEEDAPTSEELFLRSLLESAKRIDPFIQGQMFEATGLATGLQLPAPQNGTVPATDAASEAVPQAPPSVPGAPVVPTPPAPAPAAPSEPLEAGDDTAPIAAAATPRRHVGDRLGVRLMMIDRDLRIRLKVAAEQAMRRATDRAGSKIRTAASRSRGQGLKAACDGVSFRLIASTLGRATVESLVGAVDDLIAGEFDDVVGDMGAWIDVSALQALHEIETAVGRELAPEVRAEFLTRSRMATEAAGDWLREALVSLLSNRMFESAISTAPGEGPIGATTFTVPEGLIRHALAIAGGDRPTETSVGGLSSEDGSPVGGVATGPYMSTVEDAEGLDSALYVWDYGSAPRNPFEPHLALDGTEFSSWDDPALSNEEGFPDAASFFPGDHEGCTCDWHVIYGPVSDPEEG